MPNWEDKVHDAANRVEDELQRLIRQINDEVVPDVRRHSSAALRSASEQLAKLAQHLDDSKRQ